MHLILWFYLQIPYPYISTIITHQIHSSNLVYLSTLRIKASSNHMSGCTLDTPKPMQPKIHHNDQNHFVLPLSLHLTTYRYVIGKIGDRRNTPGDRPGWQTAHSSGSSGSSGRDSTSKITLILRVQLGQSAMSCNEMHCFRYQSD